MTTTAERKALKRAPDSIERRRTGPSADRRQHRAANSNSASEQLWKKKRLRRKDDVVDAFWPDD